MLHGRGNPYFDPFYSYLYVGDIIRSKKYLLLYQFIFHLVFRPWVVSPWKTSNIVVYQRKEPNNSVFCTAVSMFNALQLKVQQCLCQ